MKAGRKRTSNHRVVKKWKGSWQEPWQEDGTGGGNAVGASKVSRHWPTSRGLHIPLLPRLDEVLRGNGLGCLRGRSERINWQDSSKRENWVR